MRYSQFARLETQPGKRDEVVELLLRDSEELRAGGCEIYVVNISLEEADAVWVMEVWESKEAHAAFLKIPKVREGIAAAMPLFTGQFEGVELRAVGGLGLTDPTRTGEAARES